MDKSKVSKEALRKIEDVVTTMTDMAHIRRNSRTNNDHHMEISPALVKEAIEAFNLFDKDGNHGLDIDELGHVFRAVGQNPSDAELREIMKKHDLNSSGKLEQDQFEKMIQSYMKPMWQVKEELKDAFRIFDKDGNGTIDKQELCHVLKKYGEPLTHRQSKELIDLMDKNGDGRVDMEGSGKLEQDQFEKMIQSYMKPMWQVKEELKDAFRIFDKDGNGTIDKQELCHVLKKYGEPLTHRQSKELIDLMDKNGDGRVDMEDFVQFLCEVDQPDYFKTHYPNSPRASKP